MDNAARLDNDMEEYAEDGDLGWAMHRLKLAEEHIRVLERAEERAATLEFANEQLRKQIARLQWRQEEEDKFQDYLTEEVR